MLILSDYTAFIFCERNLHFLELCNCSKIDESFLIHDLNLSVFFHVHEHWSMPQVTAFLKFIITYKKMSKTVTYLLTCLNYRSYNIVCYVVTDSNMTSFFRFVNKRASYPFGIISLAHAPVNVTDFSIGSMNCVRHFPQT